MSLIRLLYVSRYVLGCEDAAVREIAAQSARRNAAVQLSGILVHVGDSFVQVLEGPADTVERTFEAICCDFRHEDVKLIDLVPITERMFPQEGMAFLGAGDGTAPGADDDLEEIRFLVGVNAREAVEQMRRLLQASRVAA
jgi:hypothetical protein